MNTQNQKLSTGWAFFIYSILIIVIILAGWIAPKGLNWIVVGISMFLFIIVMGLNVTGRSLGILINERKLMSLSRFQIVVWTVIVLSAYFTMVLVRIRAGIPNPLDIEMGWHLWALMGISTTSLVGTSLIHSVKKRKEPDTDLTDTENNLLKKVGDAFGETKDDVEQNKEGILYGNKDISDARFADMFEGDELKNTPFIDMSKVQMFFFTIIAVLSYVVVLFNMFTNDRENLKEFPALSEGLIAILAISHAGYLGSKSVDHTKVK